MDVRIDATAWTAASGDWLVVPVVEEFAWDEPLKQLDAALGGQISRLREVQDFTGKASQTLTIWDARGLAARRLLLVGLGKFAESSPAPGPNVSPEIQAVQKALMTAIRQVSAKAGQRVAFALPTRGSQPTPAEWAVTTAQACVVAPVGQDGYRKEKGRGELASVHFLAPSEAEAARLRPAIDEGIILGTAVNLTRSLVNEPPQVIFPASFADRALQAARDCGLACEVLDEAALKAERMGSLLAVAQGSVQPPRVVCLEHKGSGQGPVIALVGKGVTFDSGGLSLKPNDGMLTMKCDMAGAATVLGAMTAIAKLKLPVRVLGFMGLVENMPSGSAFKLGDILHARNGVTIEVQNTDAEGRLVLADVLSYALDKGAEKLIDLATLTGACVVALGEEVSGAFANNQAWCDELLAAARRAGEDVWPMPMFDHFNELIKSDVADIRNIGGRWGGAITAAKFLERFVAGKPWVHLDIAGPSFAGSNKPHREGGGTGCMVRTLVELVRSASTT